MVTTWQKGESSDFIGPVGPFNMVNFCPRGLWQEPQKLNPTLLLEVESFAHIILKSLDSIWFAPKQGNVK
jgi:hypothetical protein